MSAGDTRAAFLKLRITLAKDDVKNVLRSVDSLEQGYLDLHDAEIAAARGAKEYLTDAVKRAEINKKVAKSFGNIKDEIKDATAAQKGFLTSGVKDQLKTLRTENRAESFAARSILSAIPGGGGQAGQAANEIFELIDVLPDLGVAFQVLKASVLDTLKTIGGVFGGGALAGGVLVVGALAAAGAIALLSQKFNEAKEAVTRRIESENKYIEIVKSSTSIQIQELLKKARLDQTIAQAQFDNAAKLASKFVPAIDDILHSGSQFEIIAKGISHALEFPEASAAAEALTAANDKLAETTNLVDVYTRALGDQDVAINDTIAHFEELIKEFHELQNLRVDATISATIAAAKLTEEQAKERLAAIQLETKAIQDGLLVTGQSEEHLNQLRLQLHKLGIEADVLSDSMQQIRARDLAADFKELAKIEQEVAVLQQEHNDKLKELNQERIDAENKAYAERKKAFEKAEEDARKALIEAGKDRDEAIAEVERKGAEESQEIEEDHQKNLAKIRREFNRSSEQAIQDRDAVALDAAERKRDDDLHEEEEGYKERQRNLEKNLIEENRKINARYEEQKRNVDARLSEQRQIIDARYKEQLVTIQQANAKAIQAENERYQKEYQLKINAVNTLLGIEQQGVKATLALHTQFWQYAVQLAKNAGLSVASAYTGKPPQLSNTGKAPPGTGIKIPPLASGGYIQRDGLAYLHAGETVIPARGQGGGDGVTINIAGAQEQMLTAKTYAQTMQIVGTTLKRMGMR